MTLRPIRHALSLTLLLTGAAFAQQAPEAPPATAAATPAATAPADAEAGAEAGVANSAAETATPVATTSAPGPRALPPMQFYSTIAGDEVYDLLRAKPEFASLDKDLAGTPLYLFVTHTIRPTAGGAAAGAFTALLSGSTLGLIPMVTNEEFVVRYEIWLQGKPIATYTFSRTKTRAFSLWSGGGADKYHGLGKEGLAWLKQTADEFADKARHDPKLAALQTEIDYYFPVAAKAAK